MSDKQEPASIQTIRRRIYHHPAMPPLFEYEAKFYGLDPEIVSIDRIEVTYTVKTPDGTITVKQ